MYLCEKATLWHVTYNKTVKKIKKIKTEKHRVDKAPDISLNKAFPYMASQRSSGWRKRWSSSGEQELRSSHSVWADGALSRLLGLHSDSGRRQQYFKWNQGCPEDVSEFSLLTTVLPASDPLRMELRLEFKSTKEAINYGASINLVLFLASPFLFPSPSLTLLSPLIWAACEHSSRQSVLFSSLLLFCPVSFSLCCFLFFLPLL